MYGRLAHREIPIDIRSKVYRRFPVARGTQYDDEFARLLDDLGKSSTLLNIVGGPKISIPLSGLRLFLSIRQNVWEQLDWYVIDTRVQIALSGLSIGDDRSAHLSGEFDFGDDSEPDDYPNFGHSSEWRRVTESGPFAPSFHNTDPLSISTISIDPRGVDPLTVAEVSSTAYGRDNTRAVGAVVLGEMERASSE